MILLQYPIMNICVKKVNLRILQNVQKILQHQVKKFKLENEFPPI